MNINLSNTENLSDPLEIGNKKFENHPNVYAIRQNDPINQKLCFSNTDVSDTALNNKRNGTFGNTQQNV